MDGTFIPLQGNLKNRSDLRELQAELDRNAIALMYVTGRHLELVLDAIRSHGLPSPPWMICDVGATIYQATDAGRYVPLDAYDQHLGELAGQQSRDDITQRLRRITELRPQEDAKQSKFKISYYCDSKSLDQTVANIETELERANAPYRIIGSIDPFNGDGLIDLLPSGVSKAYALQWWASHVSNDQDSIVFAGDSGNDIAALTAGYRSIVVGNAEESVVQEVRRIHKSEGWNHRLIVSTSPATSGVLEGLRFFLVPGPPSVDNPPSRQ